ncbi:MAG: transcriptional regulator NrdR [Dehalococcoidia bacterium]|nr:transcriptional regulator NrdR [Dehalococcoidia bacterium]
MKCPFCQHRDSKVVDSRDSESSIRRRRECLSCGRRFTTYERVELAPLMIVKRDNRREEFSREKLLQSLRKACDKRPVTPTAIEEMVDAVEAELNQRPGNEVRSDDIAEAVMTLLRERDQIAYIRYASAYRDFADLDRLREELDKLAQEREEQRFRRDQIPLFTIQEMNRLLKQDQRAEKRS